MTPDRLSKHSACAVVLLVVALVVAIACTGAQATDSDSVVRPLRAPQSAHLSVGVQHQAPSDIAGSRSACARSVSSPDPGQRDRSFVRLGPCCETPRSFIGTTAPLRI